MARARFREKFDTLAFGSPFFQVVPNGIVQIFEVGTTTPIAQDIYLVASGGTPQTQPLTCEDDGSLEFWLPLPQDVKLTVDGSGSGLGTLTVNVAPVNIPADEQVSRFGGTGRMRMGTAATPAATDAYLDIRDPFDFTPASPITQSYAGLRVWIGDGITIAAEEQFQAAQENIAAIVAVAEAPATQTAIDTPATGLLHAVAGYARARGSLYPIAGYFQADVLEDLITGAGNGRGPAVLNLVYNDRGFTVDSGAVSMIEINPAVDESANGVNGIRAAGNGLAQTVTDSSFIDINEVSAFWKSADVANPPYSATPADSTHADPGGFWNRAIRIGRGSALIGIQHEPQQSQQYGVGSIQDAWLHRDAGGVERTSYELLNASGEWLFRAYAGVYKFQAVNSDPTAAGTTYATLSSAGLSTSGIVATGDILLSSSKRIFIDGSSADDESRTLFQGIAANTATDVGVIPNGSATAAGFIAYNASDPTDASTVQIEVDATKAYLKADRASGSGTYRALEIWTSGAVQQSIATTGIATFTANVQAPAFADATQTAMNVRMFIPTGDGSSAGLVNDNDKAAILGVTGHGAGTRATLLITDDANRFAIYNLRGASDATAENLDPGAAYSVTKDAAGTTNIYWDAGNNRYELQNKTGATRGYWIHALTQA